MDIIVTTPKREIANAAAEAAEVIADGGGRYFRHLGRRPEKTKPGERIFYVEDGYIRGFAIILLIEYCDMKCATTGRMWTGINAGMDATTWQWIRPIPMRGFQGWRYFTAPPDMEIVGNWLDPKPPTPSASQKTELGFTV